MKKYIFLTTYLFLFFYSDNLYSQRYEWYRTLIPELKFDNNNFLLNGQVSELSNFIIINSNTISKNLIIEFYEDTVIKDCQKKNNTYFVVFDKKGNYLKSKIIEIPNGISQMSGRFKYNKSNNFIYCTLRTTSDSIKFDNKSQWQVIKKKNKSEYNFFILIYDLNFNYIMNIPVNADVYDFDIDSNGNMYIVGSFKDSLIFNNKKVINAKTKYTETFFLKINKYFEMLWANEAISDRCPIAINEFKESIYTSFQIENNISKVFYSDGDSLIFPENNVPVLAICEFSTTDGKLKKYTTIICESKIIDLSLIKSCKNSIITNFKILGSDGLVKIKSGIDTFIFNKNIESKFIAGFNTDDLKLKFVNHFDKLSNFSMMNNFNLTNIYSDSIYTLIGKTEGNQNFGFKGENIYTSDLLKAREEDLPSDFIATYSTSNKLLHVWYLTDKTNIPYSSFYEFTDIIADESNIYLLTSIPNLSQLGLGKHEFIYRNTTPKSITLVKYNCKPSAFFKYTRTGNQINLKNLSTGLCKYRWQVKKNTNYSKARDTVYTISNTDSLISVSLFVTNLCGTDTFENIIHLKTDNINFNLLNKITIYPNPVNDRFFVDIPQSNNDELIIYINDMYGKQISSFITTQSIDINTSQCSRGIYFLRIINPKNNQTINYKLMLE